MLKMLHSFVTKIKELLLMNKGGIGSGKMFTTTIVKRSHTLPTSETYIFKDMACRNPSLRLATKARA
jgi:hypothetical protein